MKYSTSILIVGTLLSSGCSMMVAGSGTDCKSLTTKEQVHKEFGKPKSTKTIEGEVVEEYTTRRKFADADRSQGLGMVSGVTFGLAELILFPCEVCLLGKRSLVGQHLRVTYDAEDNVTRVDLDGSSRVTHDKETKPNSESAKSPRVQSADAP